MNGRKYMMRRQANTQLVDGPHWQIYKYKYFESMQTRTPLADIQIQIQIFRIYANTHPTGRDVLQGNLNTPQQLMRDFT